jgi:ubiquinone/menaquinone biosynthesis C-methylase UbiE
MTTKLRMSSLAKHNVWNPIWETVYSTQNWGKYPSESLIQFVAKHFYGKIRQDTHLLEVGCGPGANIWFLAREGFDATGIDGSITAINKAQKRLDDENLSAKLIVGDVNRLPFGDNEFDGVIDVECLYCMDSESMESILHDIARVIKPGGHFYSRTFSTDLYVGQEPVRINKYEYSSVHDGPQAGRGFMRLSDKEEIRRLYGAQFEIVSIDKLIHTRDNESFEVSEWVINCLKR